MSARPIHDWSDTNERRGRLCPRPIRPKTKERKKTQRRALVALTARHIQIIKNFQRFVNPLSRSCHCEFHTNCRHCIVTGQFAKLPWSQDLFESIAPHSGVTWLTIRAMPIHAVQRKCWGSSQTGWPPLSGFGKMVDRLSSTRRSLLMARIRGKNTAPEMAVRRWLHASGLRYRLHAEALPGRPDLVFPSRRVCVFVHGCFWHGCPHCNGGMHHVKSNLGYWRKKMAANAARDAKCRELLAEAGWRVFVIWECQTRNVGTIRKLAKAIRRTPLIRH